MSSKVLSIKTINPNIVKLEYAVRGPIVQQAAKFEVNLAQVTYLSYENTKKSHNLPFSEVIRCNIGDCHATGQPPITFFRQVIAGLTLPSITKQPWFPSDAKDRGIYN